MNTDEYKCTSCILYDEDGLCNSNFIDRSVVSEDDSIVTNPFFYPPDGFGCVHFRQKGEEGKLIESTDVEYNILRAITDAINGAHIPKDKFEERFFNQVIGDIETVLSLFYDKNNLKRKYYMCRKSNK